MGNTCCQQQKQEAPASNMVVIQPSQEIVEDVIETKAPAQVVVKSSNDHQPTIEPVTTDNDRQVEQQQIKQETVTFNQDAPFSSVAISYDQKIEVTNAEVIKALARMGEFKNSSGQQNVDLSSLKPYIFTSNQAIYVGEWKSGNREGYGRQYWNDGSQYEGEWKNNHQNGFGRLIHTDGDAYQGMWKDDKAEGKGTYIHQDGARYEGDWVADQQSGKGLEIWQDGARYEGEYVDGKKHGKGKFEWADGSKYDGDFYDNNIQGKGIYTWQDGRKYVGDWLANKMHGKGFFTWSDGKKYEGDYFEDKKEGQGKFNWPDGKVYNGQWKDGKQHGEGTLIIGDQVAKGLWQNGKRTKWLHEDDATQVQNANAN